MIIYIFGNENLKMDSLPLRILPSLRAKFPEIKFEVKDPNEEWDAPEELVVIDTAVGIKKITVFDSLEKFSAAPRVSMHDFDALANLQLLQKIGKIKNIKIIGVPAISLSDGPPEIDEKEAVKKISREIVKNTRV